VAPACDLVVAAERACFLLAFVNLGLCPTSGSVDVAKVTASAEDRAPRFAGQ
jgi:enoyl-CoA hydratase/carnithine racemase